VFALVFRDGARQTLIGILAGLVLSLGVVRLIAMQLPQLAVGDPIVVVAAIAILVSIALAAALLPAVRAARVDPALVLRGE
jgi:ABC-type antimicrobial peptide transport system permease subunit